MITMVKVIVCKLSKVSVQCLFMGGQNEGACHVFYKLIKIFGIIRNYA